MKHKKEEVETPLSNIAQEILGGVRNDILTTKEDVAKLRDRLEAATEDAFKEFAENQRKSIEMAPHRWFISASLQN